MPFCSIKAGAARPRRWLGAALFSAALSLFVLACEPANEVGLDVLPDDVPVSATYVELYGTAATVRRNDSVLTANKAGALVGDLLDGNVGRTTAECYWQVRPISTNPDQPLQGAIADSLVLTFGINQFYGTADESQKLEAYELTEGFDADKSYYAESPGLMTGTRLGETTFKLRYGYVKADSALVTPWIVGSTKKRADSTRVLKPVRFNIKDTVLARRLLARIGTTDFSSLTEFQKVLKGVAIRPATSTSGAIVSLDPLASATRLTLYYHVSTDSLAHVHTFSLGNAAQQERYFTRITTDYSKGEQLTAFTPASTPAERDTVTAGPPHFTAYLQGGLELATRIRLTGFEPLLARQGHIAINRAELIVPVKPYAVGVYPVPGQAYLVEVDAQNRPLTTAGQLRTVQANGAYPAGTSQPAVVVYDPNLRAYRVVITSYLDARLNNKLTDQRGDAFWLVPTLPGVTGLGLNRALIDAAKDQIRLKVYYSELN